jgi:hypothetical protein
VSLYSDEKVANRNVREERQEYLDRIETSLERDVSHLVGTVAAWIARLVRVALQR